MKAVLRFQPIDRQGLMAVGAHNSRDYTKETLPTHIDASRIRYNKVLIGPKQKQITSAMVAAIDGIPMARKSNNSKLDLVMCECVLSATPEFFKNKEITEKWTQQSLEWLKKEFGDKLLSAVLHLDEQTPHIHAVITVDVVKSRTNPVTKQKMESKRILCYSDTFVDRKEVLTKARKEGRSHVDTKLGRFQTRYAEAVGNLGLERGVESARTKDIGLIHAKTKLESEIASLRRKKKEEEENLQKIRNEVVKQGEELYEKAIATVRQRINNMFLCKKNPNFFLHMMKKADADENMRKIAFLNQYKNMSEEMNHG